MTSLVIYASSVTGAYRMMGEQRGHDEKKDFNLLPLKPERVIEFDTTEGTRMSLDVSPDGKTLVFDLLGDIYVLPIDGGEAKRITSGLPMDQYPHFSPDGRRIAFASDRNGLANLYTMATDGKDVRPITHYTAVMDPASPRHFLNLEWSRDGKSIIAAELRVGSPIGEVPEPSYTRFEVSGTGKRDLLRPPKPYPLPLGLAPDPDGVHFWTVKESPSGNKLEKREQSTEKLITARELRQGTIGALEFSPDGRWVAYRLFDEDRRTGTFANQLRIVDVQSSQTLNNDRALVERAGAYSRYPFHADTPRISFTPDAKSVVYWSDGKIKRVDISNGRIVEIPFRARVGAALGALVPAPVVDFSGPLNVKQMRSMNSTADGKTIVFDALGKVWKVVSGGNPRRLTTTNLREYDPVLSPDGHWVAYATWSYHDGGRLWKIPASDGDPIMLGQSKDILGTPRWTPDGKQIVALRTSSASMTGVMVKDQAIVAVFASGGEPLREITKTNADSNQRRPALTVSSDGRRVFFAEGGRSSDPTDTYMGLGFVIGNWAKLMSVGLDGSDRTFHAEFRGQEVDPVVSPDGKWIAVQHSFNIHLMPMLAPIDSKPPMVKMGGIRPEPTARPISLYGGAEPIWSSDGKWLFFSWAGKFFRVSYQEATSTKGPLDAKSTAINLTVPRYEPKGPPSLLTNARVVTMAESGSLTYSMTGGKSTPTDPKVIERGDILIDGSRIRAVGPSGTLTAPKNAQVIDLSGKTIVPGFIATHEHTWYGRAGHYTPEELPQYASFLASGITMTQDPWGYYPASYADEMVAAGELTGHRRVGGLNGTSHTYWQKAGGGEDIPNQRAADALVKKHKDHGAYLVKEYGQSHRIQREWLAIAAKKYGVKLSADNDYGRAEFTMLLDGWTETAHDRYGGDAYADLEELAARSATNFFQLYAENTFADAGVKRKIPLLKAFVDRGWMPPYVVDAGNIKGWSFRSELIASMSRHFEDKAESAVTPMEVRVGMLLRKRMADGISLQNGTDNGSGYLVSHTRLWNYRRFGLTTAELLRVFTINGARTLGVENDLGSIERGKLADLVILNSNPLDDITNTIDIKYVVKSGEVFNPTTMDVLWPTPRKFKMFPWAKKPDAEAATR